MANLIDYSHSVHPPSDAPRGPHGNYLVHEFKLGIQGLHRLRRKTLLIMWIRPHRSQHWWYRPSSCQKWSLARCRALVGILAFRDFVYDNVLFDDDLLSHWPTQSVLPYRRHIPSIFHLRPEEKTSFADILSKITKRYDNLFSCSFAYSMGIHQRPIPLSSPEETDEDDVAHLHLHFSPPLLRSATVKKFMAGWATNLSDWTPWTQHFLGSS